MTGLSTQQLGAAAIALLTFAALAIGKVPRLQMNRAAIALVGAGAVMVFGIVSFEQALKTIDLGTIFLLLSMMGINAVLEPAGFFT
jgi:Na+/H+ antiporter NhaD/arsenite permease-like protein